MGKQTNLEKSSITCKHCGKTFHSYIGLSKHLKRQNISSEVYYDTYIKTPSEGMCKMCGKHPFNCNDEKDVTKANKWLNSDSEFSNRAYYIWTVRDVEKYNTAIQNSVRYVCIYDLDDFLSKSYNSTVFLNITVKEFKKILER